jgi:uncharacterized membrane protein YcaP (DUF421 family)
MTCLIGGGVQMLIILVRTAILYISVVVAMRIMGKQQIGQLQPFELVITIMLSELAAIPMQDPGIPLLNGLTPILTLITLQVITSYTTLKSEKARAVICGTPSILIENGKIIESELFRLRYSISDLLEQLRSKNMPNISDVEFAILETNGNLNIIPKSQKRPLTPEDLSLSTKYEGIPHPLIMDGLIISDNLKDVRLDLTWLEQQLTVLGINNPKEVLFASIDSEGRFYCQKKNTGSKG